MSQFKENGFTREQVFADLRNRDPDGWETKPTKSDYQAFQSYAVSKYGKSWYRRYLAA